MDAYFYWYYDCWYVDLHAFWGVSMPLRIERAKNEEWGTPQLLFDRLNEFYQFTVDAAASDSNHKCGGYWTKEQDGLYQIWHGKRIWINPPYNSKAIMQWITKVFYASNRNSIIAVMLVPVKSDQKWWRYAIEADQIYLSGRIRFEIAPGIPTKNTTFQPSVILSFPRMLKYSSQFVWNYKDMNEPFPLMKILPGFSIRL